MKSYDKNEVRKAYSPSGGELPRTGTRNQSDIHYASIESPYSALRGKRQRVATNIRTDALENEYANHRISSEAYLAGRRYQSILERARGHTASVLYNEGRGGYPGDHPMIKNLQRAKDVEKMRAETLPILGRTIAPIVDYILSNNCSITQCADALRTANRLGIAIIGDNFRRGLEELSKHWDYRG